jgi:hypothetical protein
VGQCAVKFGQLAMRGGGLQAVGSRGGFQFLSLPAHIISVLLFDHVVAPQRLWRSATRCVKCL